MKKLKIGNIELESNIILAPMAGITNLAYRRLLKPFGCGLVVSEMISDFALIYSNNETFEMIKDDKEEHPSYSTFWRICFLFKRRSKNSL